MLHARSFASCHIPVSLLLSGDLEGTTSTYCGGGGNPRHMIEARVCSPRSSTRALCVVVVVVVVVVGMGMPHIIQDFPEMDDFRTFTTAFRYLNPNLEPILK